MAKIEELIREYAAGNVGSNLVTVTMADPDTYALAAAQPERYELVRVRMGGWTEFFSAMFPRITTSTGDARTSSRRRSLRAGGEHPLAFC